MTVEAYFTKELTTRGLTPSQIEAILVQAKSESPASFKWNERLRQYPDTLLEFIRAIINRIVLKCASKK